MDVRELFAVTCLVYQLGSHEAVLVWRYVQWKVQLILH